MTISATNPATRSVFGTRTIRLSISVEVLCFGALRSKGDPPNSAGDAFES
jgi:hypothetical protein